MNAKAEVLEKRIEYVEEKLSEFEDKVDNSTPSDKGYPELVKAYNNWADLYTQLIDELDHLEEVEAKNAKIESEKKIDLILRVAELGVKAAGVAVPVLAIMASVGVAKLSYVQDQKLALRNGNVFGNAKDLMQIAKIKVV